MPQSSRAARGRRERCITTRLGRAGHVRIPGVAIRRRLVLAALAASLISGCGAVGQPSQTSPVCDGSVSIGGNLPLSATDKSQGTEVDNAIRLAIEQANANFDYSGCFLKYEAMDDAKDGVENPARAAANTDQFAANPAIVGVIGPESVDAQIAAAAVATQRQLALVPALGETGATLASRFASDYRLRFNADPGTLAGLAFLAADRLLSAIQASVAAFGSLKDVPRAEVRAAVLARLGGTRGPSPSV